MRWTLLAWAAGLVCAAALMGVGAGPMAGRLAATHALYAPEGTIEVIATLLSAQNMYDSKTERWVLYEMRIDSLPGAEGGPSASSGSGKGEPKAELRIGEVLSVQYQMSKMLPPPRRSRPGDQVRAFLKQEEGPKGKGWVAVGTVETVGRGEAVLPGKNPAIELGSPEAKVLVKVLAPLGTECHQKTVELLKELSQREPKRLWVQVFDPGTVEGKAEMMRERLHCATVLINNRFEFTLGDRKVTLSHRPNDPKSTYNSEDVITIAQQEIARVYAPPPAPPKGGKRPKGTQ